MKRLFALGIVSAALVGLVPTGASAHEAGPCNASGEPGNSDYAQHHIVALAHEGHLGNGGHKPGTHAGFSLCNPSGR